MAQMPHQQGPHADLDVLVGRLIDGSKDCHPARAVRPLKHEMQAGTNEVHSN